MAAGLIAMVFLKDPKRGGLDEVIPIQASSFHYEIEESIKNFRMKNKVVKENKPFCTLLMNGLKELISNPT